MILGTAMLLLQARWPYSETRGILQAACPYRFRRGPCDFWSGRIFGPAVPIFSANLRENYALGGDGPNLVWKKVLV